MIGRVLHDDGHDVARVLHQRRVGETRDDDLEGRLRRQLPVLGGIEGGLEGLHRGREQKAAGQSAAPDTGEIGQRGEREIDLRRHAHAANRADASHRLSVEALTAGEPPRGTRIVASETQRGCGGLAYSRDADYGEKGAGLVEYDCGAIKTK